MSPTYSGDVIPARPLAQNKLIPQRGYTRVRCKQLNSGVSDKSRLADRIVIILIALVIAVTIGYHYLKDKAITDYTQHTVGKILDVSHINKTRYSLNYEYLVDGKKYAGSVGVHYFDCSQINGCIGYEIDVKYSVENPSMSQVNLRDFEEFKTTVYLRD